MRRLALVALVLLGCERSPASTQPDPATNAQAPSAAPAPQKEGAVLLRGLWRVDGFEPAPGAPSTSAAALQAQASSPEAQAVRIQYTGDQVRIMVPGQMPLASTYEVKESRPYWVRILNGKDEVVITFQDDDHMTVDRKNNAFGAKMKMRRATDVPPPPKPGASVAVIPALPPSAKVVGTSAAGHPIVKIGAP